ncbi:MAG: SRPBCC domain-containing protein [Phycisphaerae bacterium]|nr:SRPBCC domain-containing protein [Phycisphaerae bacterium]
MSISSDSRDIRKEITILARADRVWRALTEASELMQWYSLSAAVVPGGGGVVRLSSPGVHEFEMPIAAWEPNRRLACTQAGPGASALEFVLEESEAETRLRLTHSGFSAPESADFYLERAVRDWEFYLQALKLYLERHDGTPRRCVVCQAEASNAVPAGMWSRLWSEAGMLRVTHPEPTAEGRRYAITTAQGDRLEGVVHTWSPPMDFSATVTNLNDSWLRVHLVDLRSQGRCIVNLWLSTYGVEARRVLELQSRFDRMFAELFGEAG